jgi:ankyrin repeat protein
MQVPCASRGRRGLQVRGALMSFFIVLSICRPIAASDNSPRHKAYQFLLIGGLPNEGTDALRSLTRDSDFVDDQNYTGLHRIVLGLSMRDLEKELYLHPDDINTTDAMGRTPLAWAACRGDERAVVTLLQHGAKVNTVDVQCSGVVGHAADRDSVTCVRLLLEAGADPDIAAAYGHNVGNPLNVAVRNASDPLILKTLLDFGADVESSGIDGMTPLIHAARKDNASFATLLLEYGADINAISVARQTPLTTAVTFNSHNVLRLLLDRWSEYSVCPRLTGPHLLEIVALYADIETMTILTGSDHLHLKHDQNYLLGDFSSQLSARPDATEKLILAFKDLLSVIENRPENTPRSVESLMESGFLSVHNNPDMPGSDSEGSDQEFLSPRECLSPNGPRL